MIDGNKKKTNTVSPENKPFIPNGEFTIFDDPADTVKKSNIPAVLAAINTANTKKIAAYI